MLISSSSSIIKISASSFFITEQSRLSRSLYISSPQVLLLANSEYSVPSLFASKKVWTFQFAIFTSDLSESQQAKNGTHGQKWRLGGVLHVKQAAIAQKRRRRRKHQPQRQRGEQMRAKGTEKAAKRSRLLQKQRLTTAAQRGCSRRNRQYAQTAQQKQHVEHHQGKKLLPAQADEAGLQIRLAHVNHS